MLSVRVGQERYQDQIKLARWVIRLRWIGQISIFVTSALVRLFVPYDFTPVIVILVAVAAYTILAWLHTRSCETRGPRIWPGELRLTLNLQVMLDLIVLAVAIHLTGGVESVLVPVYLVYLPAAGLILPRRMTFLQAVLALVLLGTVFWLEYSGRLAHGHLGSQYGGIEPNLYTNAAYVVTNLTFQACFLYLALHMAYYIRSQFDRLVEAERRSRQQAETLQQMAAALGSTLVLEQLLNLVLVYLEKLIAYDSATVMLVEGEIARVVAARGFPDLSRTLAVEVTLSDDAFFREVSTSQRPVVLKDAAADPRFRQLSHTDYVRSWICAPLIVRQAVIGLLTVGSRRPSVYDENDIALVQTFTRHAALAVENAQLYEKTRHLALTDGLTGLYNHRHFYTLLSQELLRSQRYGHTLSLLVCDLDEFKKYNDRYGHLAGDDLLRTLAALITDRVRSSDVVFRYGGEEFAVILPETTRLAAVALAERLRQAVQDHEFVVHGDVDVGRITISVGVAAYPDDASDVKGLVSAADKALLQAKLQRNQVCVASAPGSSISTL